MAAPQSKKILLGEAAEHLVLARLLRRGHLASQAPRTWKADDILGQDGLRIQVKATTNGKKHGWMVGSVDADPHRFYALVNFANETNPDIYILPSQDVREAADAAHREGLRRSPRARDIPMRKIQDPFRVEVHGYPEGWLEKYHEAWEKLNQTASGADGESRSVRRGVTSSHTIVLC